MRTIGIVRHPAAAPLILIPSTVAKLWGGTAGEASDYERACAVTDELGRIEVAGVEVLVLGDEPHRATIVKRGATLLILRWTAAASEGHVLAASNDVGSVEFGSPSVELRASEREAILMDAAAPPGDARGLSVDLDPGVYVVDTAYRRTQDCHLLLHRMTLRR